MRAEDEVHAPLRLERAHVQVAPHLTHGVDPDLVAERLEHVQVGMRATLDAGVAAEQLGRERERGRALADPGRPVEEVRVGRALGKSRAQEPLRLLLLKNAVEARGAPLPRSRAAGACRRAR